MNDPHDTSVRKDVMDAIRTGAVRMRPRWHFVLLSLLSVLGVLILLLTLLYVSSLIVFFLRDSGAWFAPAFGGRGWSDLLTGVSWRLVPLILLFIVVLELVVRRYRFVYKQPLLLSVLGILILVTVGGILIGQTPFHRQILISARHGELPPPMRFVYDDGALRPPPGELYRGTIISMGTSSFVISNANRPGTTTVLLSPRTRLPYGGDFGIGGMVVVIGDPMSTGTVRAFGVQEIGE